MFPDSAIAKKNFALSERKCSFLVSFGLAPYFTSLLETKLFKRNFVLLFDKSMNKSFQLKQMDFHLSRDGPNENWSFHEKVNKLLGENYGTELLNVGSCGLHKVHGACKSVMVAAGWGLEKVLKSMYRLLEDTPARHEDYFRTSQSTQAPLKFCAHRWLENSKVAQRAFDILPHLKNHKQNLLKLSEQQPTMTYFYLPGWHFFVSLNKQLEPFLRKYQTDNLLLPFLSTYLHNINIAILRQFVKKERIASLSRTRDILNFSVNGPQNHVTGHTVDIGFVADSVFKDLKREREN
ncbi:unnamed protein product [Candidula unifasciata]|uniref:Uncharacterized protein n=1 Tax=Candidula unifasciata TaxID=100452 RepID=A0A8S3YXX0_9EUPU|nr:unnamed protein product [Candidula unifasciata]